MTLPYRASPLDPPHRLKMTQPSSQIDCVWLLRRCGLAGPVEPAARDRDLHESWRSP